MAHWTDVITEETTAGQIGRLLDQHEVTLMHPMIRDGEWTVLLCSRVTSDVAAIGRGELINGAIVDAALRLDVVAIARRGIRNLVVPNAIA